METLDSMSDQPPQIETPFYSYGFMSQMGLLTSINDGDGVQLPRMAYPSPYSIQGVVPHRSVRHGYLPHRHGYLPHRHGYLPHRHGYLPESTYIGHSEPLSMAGNPMTAPEHVLVSCDLATGEQRSENKDVNVSQNTMCTAIDSSRSETERRFELSLEPNLVFEEYNKDTPRLQPYSARHSFIDRGILLTPPPSPSLPALSYIQSKYANYKDRTYKSSSKVTSV